MDTKSKPVEVMILFGNRIKSTNSAKGLVLNHCYRDRRLRWADTFVENMADLNE